MMLASFNVLRRVDFGLLSVLHLCSTTLEFPRVVRATSLPFGSTLKVGDSALKEARLAQHSKKQELDERYNKESNKTLNKTFYKYFHLFYHEL